MTKHWTPERTPRVRADLVGDACPGDDRSGESPTTADAPAPNAPSTEQRGDDEAERPLGSSARRRIRRIVVFGLPIALVLLLVGAVVGPYVYIHFIEGDPPKKLGFETTDSTTAGKPSTPAAVVGAWKVTDGSTVGYRVPETLMGQSTTAVGRAGAEAVTGNLEITDTSVPTADFTVDVTKLSGGNPGRDSAYAHVMDTVTFPTATFTLTTPIALASVPADLEQITVPVTGNLTLHGMTKPVTFDLKARRNGTKIETNGLIPITFSNYGIANPSDTFASVGDNGELEFLLVFARG